MYVSIYIASGLWLFAIRSHYVFEGGVEFAIPTEHIDRTHQNLIQVTIFLREGKKEQKNKIIKTIRSVGLYSNHTYHQMELLRDGILEYCPDLLQVFAVGVVQMLT